MGLVIRSYEPKDSRQVLVLAEKYASWDTTPTEPDLGGFWSSDPELFLVAEADGRLVGFLVGRESRDMPDEVLRRRGATRAGSIETLAVDAQYRRKGIATALLNRVFDLFRQNGVDYVSLAVPAEEEGARKLYEKLGFHERAYFLSKNL